MNTAEHFLSLTIKVVFTLCELFFKQFYYLPHGMREMS